MPGGSDLRLIALPSAGANEYELRLVGTFAGTSVPYAACRRGRLRSLIQGHAEKAGVTIQYHLDLDDAVQRFSDTLRSVSNSTLATSEFSLDLSGLRTKHIKATILTDKTIGKATRAQLKQLFRSICIGFNLDLADLSILDASTHSQSSLMSRVIRFIKKHQPASIETLLHEYRKLPGVHANEADIALALDTLRQRGLIIRDRFESYCLTPNGVDALPSWPGRTSPDVERALYMWRRTW